MPSYLIALSFCWVEMALLGICGKSSVSLAIKVRAFLVLGVLFLVI